MTLLCVINSLEGGGAERVFVTIVSALAQSRDAELVLLDDAEERYAPPASVRKTVLGAQGSFPKSALRLTQLVRARRPTQVLSFLTRANCAAVIAGRAAGANVVISERVHTSSHLPPSAHLERAAVKAFYPRANRVIAVSEGVREDLARTFAVPRERIAVVHNPVDLARVRAEAEAPLDAAAPNGFIVAAGRLAPNKNFAMLIRAYARARIATPLVILGEGAERPALEALTRELGLSERVLMPGHTRVPFAWFKRARAYVSASNAEGFPNALAEAMAVGTPVISTDCDSGPAEILGGDPLRKVPTLTQAPWGVLTPPGDAHAMADALTLMSNADARMHYAARASERAAHFSAARAIERYDAELTTALQAAAEQKSTRPVLG